MISAISTNQQSAPAAAAANTTQISGNATDFLQLLVTELRNQDPMKPMDPTQTVTQLATFASVEQSIKTNSLLASLGANSALAQASAIVGRTATSADGAVSGVVSSVTIGDASLVAHLTDGRSLPLGSGVSIG